MKLLLVLVFGALALSEGGVETELENEQKEKDLDFSPTPAMSANMNAYIDLIMIQVGPWILRSGYIPMELPDFIEFIEYRPLLITYTGELHLTNGVLSRLVSVARSGNAVMTYQNNMLRIAMAASVRQITFTYDYLAEIMGIGPTGWLEGNTDQMTMGCDFIIDFRTFMIHMQDFRVVSLGSINIRMRGNPLLDWLSNLIVTTVTILFRGPITDFISMRFQQLLQETIDDMNNRRFAATHSHDETIQVLHNLLSLKGFEKPLL